MKDIVSSILTDASARDNAAVETALLDKATAAPWATENL